jgi:hypothetical protein
VTVFAGNFQKGENKPRGAVTKETLAKDEEREEK